MSRLGSGLLVLILLLSCCCAVRAEQDAAVVDLDLLLAQNAAGLFRVKDASGNPLEPRKAPEMLGRGIPDTVGVEPDYRGVVGYVALQTDWEVSRFNTFSQTPWLFATYDRDGKDGWKQIGTIRHKTAVLVVDQEIRESMGHKYIGYLQVIRLDVNDKLWIDVKQFVTVPYWTLELKEAINYGYCIAVYNDKSGELPINKKKRHGPLPEGTRVLVCDKRSARYISSDMEHNPMLGIVFRSNEAGGSYFRTFLFFNPRDLTMVY